MVAEVEYPDLPPLQKVMSPKVRPNIEPVINGQLSADWHCSQRYHPVYVAVSCCNFVGNVEVSDEELASRKAKWQPREPKVTTGYLRRYAAQVTSGNRGAILRTPEL